MCPTRGGSRTDLGMDFCANRKPKKATVRVPGQRCFFQALLVAKKARVSEGKESWAPLCTRCKVTAVPEASLLKGSAPVPATGSHPEGPGTLPFLMLVRAEVFLRLSAYFWLEGPRRAMATSANVSSLGSCEVS